MLLLTFTDSDDFNQLKLGLCCLLKALYEYAHTLSLKIPQFCCSGKQCLLAANDKSVLLCSFGLVVSFGLTPTTNQFSATFSCHFSQLLTLSFPLYPQAKPESHPISLPTFSILLPGLLSTARGNLHK